MNKVIIAVLFMLFSIVYGEHPNTCYFGFCAAGGPCNESADGAISNGKLKRAIPDSGRIHCWCFKSELDCASGSLVCPQLKNVGYTGVNVSTKGTYFWYRSDLGSGESDCTPSGLDFSTYPELSGTKSCTTTNCNSPFSYVARFKITAASVSVAQSNVKPLKDAVLILTKDFYPTADEVNVLVAADSATEYMVSAT
jgi:hypothetical protein